MDPFIGQIIMFGGNFAPRGWALCDGQLLQISQFQALFSILGTTYGGDGRTTFGLPDLRGRVSVHPGNGPGLSSYNLGQKGGAEQVTLNTTQIPAHNHLVSCVSANGNQGAPAGHIPAGESVAAASVWSDANADGTMKSSMIQNTGGNKQHENRQPYQAVNYIIALTGVFPSRG